MGIQADLPVKTEETRPTPSQAAPAGVRPAMASMPAAEAVAADAEAPDVRAFLRRGLLFAAIGLLIYLALYVVADQLVYRTTVRNRFFNIKTAPAVTYDYVILGASHALPLDYDDMNQRLEAMTGSEVLNLSIAGSGVSVNRVVLDYFLSRHETRNAVYFLDSFAFYSSEWNEERLKDTELFNRAPFDLRLAWTLLRDPAGRAALPDYLLGFSKINNPDRFQTDIGDDEAKRFDKTYRPVPQIDRQRIEYLYPKQIDQAVFQGYLAQFEEMLRELREQGIGVIVIKPPIPQRVFDMIPGEAQFDATVQEIVLRHEGSFYDYSQVSNDEAYYFNPDHLNRSGVLAFYDDYLGALLAAR